MSAFSCSVCFEDFNSDLRKPILLECGHTFCSHCLATMHATFCPICRTKIKKTSKFINKQLLLSNETGCIGCLGEFVDKQMNLLECGHSCCRDCTNSKDLCAVCATRVKIKMNNNYCVEVVVYSAVDTRKYAVSHLVELINDCYSMEIKIKKNVIQYNANIKSNVMHSINVYKNDIDKFKLYSCGSVQIACYEWMSTFVDKFFNYVMYKMSEAANPLLACYSTAELCCTLLDLCKKIANAQHVNLPYFAFYGLDTYFSYSMYFMQVLILVAIIIPMFTLR